MPLYEVVEPSYINEKLLMPGSIVEYTPPEPMKVPPGASDAEKAKPQYQKTTVGPNLKLAPKNAEPNEIANETVTRSVG